jgi:hypothetical protein
MRLSTILTPAIVHLAGRVKIQPLEALDHADAILRPLSKVPDILADAAAAAERGDTPAVLDAWKEAWIVGRQLREAAQPVIDAAEPLIADWIERLRATARERYEARAGLRAARHVDTDGDGRPNRADIDDDNDGIKDRKDPAPLDPAVPDLEQHRFSTSGGKHGPRAKRVSDKPETPRE